jgi:hypothetical protein
LLHASTIRLHSSVGETWRVWYRLFHSASLVNQRRRANRASCLTGGDQGHTKLSTRPTSLVGNIGRSHPHRQHKLALGRQNHSKPEEVEGY